MPRHHQPPHPHGTVQAEIRRNHETLLADIRPGLQQQLGKEEKSEKDPRKILQREILKKAFPFKTSYGKYKKEEIDIIEVKSLEDLLEIMEEAGEDLVLGKTYHEENPCKYEITIYDYYLE